MIVAAGRSLPACADVHDLENVSCWLTPEQGRRLLEAATPSSPGELRERAMAAMSIGCGYAALNCFRQIRPG
jgi:hypothetical protein